MSEPSCGLSIGSSDYPLLEKVLTFNYLTGLRWKHHQTMKIFPFKAFTACILFLAGHQITALELPSVFSDNMVLQQEADLRIWGKADYGETVTVTFADQEVSTPVNADGMWQALLKPMKASFEEQSLKVKSGGEEKIFKNVLVGEVWLASGQSNMGWMVNQSVDSDILLLGANDPYLRLHKVAYQPSRQLEFSSRNPWTEDDQRNVKYFSSVGYQFGRDLRKTLQVPVGIIHSTVGGTPTVAWTRSGAIAKTPQLQAIDEDWETSLARYEEIMASWEKEYAVWRDAKGIRSENYEVHKRQGAPRKPEGADSPRRPASLANGMIAPIAGYTLRGAIWYQGEADANTNPETYDERLRVMIEDWRDWWNAPEMPFGIVQLPGFMKAQNRPVNSNWAKLRESQRRVAESDPNTGLAVTIELGEANDIHPPEKILVARRLARWALADVYGKIDLRGGPEIVSAVKEGSTILLTFSETGSGLHVRDAEELTGFTASDSMTEPEVWWQTNFYEVEAEVVSKTEVRLTIPQGRNPVRVRYAWQSNPTNTSLTNKERLPASPFETGISK